MLCSNTVQRVGGVPGRGGYWSQMRREPQVFRDRDRESKSFPKPGTRKAVLTD